MVDNSVVVTIRPVRPPIRALHLLTLSGFALAQPLYDLLARNPEFFIVRQSSLATVLALMLMLSLLLPAAAVGAQALAQRFLPRLGAAFHLLLVFALTGAAMLPPLNRLGQSAPLTLGAAAALGGAFALAYAKTRAVRSFVTFLSPAVLVFPLVFLFFSPVLATISTTGDLPDLPAPDLKGPVVMVVFDELPLISLLDENQRIDAGRFPNFGRLAAASTWFPNARSLSGSTGHSVSMILTGEKTNYHELPLFSEHPKNLFTLLAGAGPVSAVESATRLCPPALCDRSARSLRQSLGRGGALARDLGVVYLHLLLPRAWRDWLPPIGDNWIHFVLRGQESKSYDQRPQAFSSFVQAIPVNRPGFHFIHTFLPHVPWAYLPDGRNYSLQPWHVPGLTFTPDLWTDNRWMVMQGYRRHLLQVQLADRLLGKLLDHLQAGGGLESAMIVVTADHGCNFIPGKARRGLVKGRELDILGIPLFIKSPGQRAGSIDTAPFRTTDIVAEMARILGMSEAWRRPPPARPLPPSPWPDPQWAGSRSLREKIALFGSGAGLIPKTGPRPDLLGRLEGEVPNLGESPLEVRLREPEVFLDVDPESPFIPLQVRGQVRTSDGSSPESMWLAIAVNGAVRAVTQTYGKSGEWLDFAALLGEGDLRPGANRVDVLAIPRGSQPGTGAAAAFARPAAAASRRGRIE